MDRPEAESLPSRVDADDGHRFGTSSWRFRMDASTSRAQRRFALAIAAGLFLATSAHAQTARVDATGLQAGQQYDRFIVQYRADAGVTQLAAARDRVRRLVVASPASYAAAAPSVSHAMASSAYVVRSSQPMNAVAAEAWMRRLAEDSAIEFIEVDAQLRELAQPNDKWYPSQLHLFGGYGVGADAAWGMHQGDGVYVGVIDSGPTPHPDLDAQLLPGYDFVTRTGIRHARLRRQMAGRTAPGRPGRSRRSRTTIAVSPASRRR